jgi:membrane fusion protein, multidrug efflux system
MRAQGRLTQDGATLAEAKTDLSRYETLSAENSIARRTAEDRRYLLNQDECTIKQDEAQLPGASPAVPVRRSAALRAE